MFLFDIIVSAKCGLDTMKVQGYQPLTFRGDMYLKQSMFGCQLREMVSDIPGMRLFELEIPHRAITPCALTKTQNNEVLLSNRLLFIYTLIYLVNALST